MSPDQNEDRRPIQARDTSWARRTAGGLARSRITPNQISLASIVFAALGAGAMLASNTVGLIAAALCVQLRLLCNLFDGMVAVEYARQTPTGPLYNEFPDRVADTLFLAAAGYAAGYPELGWACALLAALTAYVRVFGAACGCGHDFRGPMAKQHRMAILTLALVAQAFRPDLPLLALSLAVIAAGSALTCVTRTLALARTLNRPQ